MTYNWANTHTWMKSPNLAKAIINIDYHGNQIDKQNVITVGALSEVLNNILEQTSGKGF